MSAPHAATPPRAERRWTPVVFRECRRCALWTECRLCPQCVDRLEPQEGPCAFPVYRGELDVLPRDLDLATRGECADCHLVAPFHSTATCPGITCVPPDRVGGPWLAPVPAPASPAPTP